MTHELLAREKRSKEGKHHANIQVTDLLDILRMPKVKEHKDHMTNMVKDP
jgi:hypothetical protein